MTDIVERLRKYQCPTNKGCNPLVEYCQCNIMDDSADEIDRLREALRSLSYIHDGNPSDEWAMVPELAYARHMLFEVRQIARAALKEGE